MAGFGDQRDYIYKGKKVDHQTHLGIDLASVRHAKVEAANKGEVVFTGFFGIYGNCIIIDHGMGLQTLYSHLSQIDVEPGNKSSVARLLPAPELQEWLEETICTLGSSFRAYL